MAKEGSEFFETYEEGQKPLGYLEPGSPEQIAKLDEDAAKLVKGTGMSLEEAHKQLQEQADSDALGYQAAKARLGRRELFDLGAKGAIESTEQSIEEAEKSGEVGVSRAIAVAPGADIRAISGMAIEAGVGADARASAARQLAAQTKMGVAISKEDAETEVESDQAKDDELKAGVIAIKAKHRGDIDDDEFAAAEEIRDMVDRDSSISPELRDKYLQQANDIASGKESVS